MLTYALTIVDRYDGMVMATCPDLPELMAIGRDFEEARDEALRGLESTLEAYAAAGRPFPDQRPVNGLCITTTRFGELTPA